MKTEHFKRLSKWLNRLQVHQQQLLSEEDELYVLHDIHAMPRSEISAPLKIEDKDCLKKLDQVLSEEVRQVRSHLPQVPCRGPLFLLIKD